MLKRDKRGRFLFNEDYANDLLANSSECWGLYQYSMMVNKFLGLFLYEDHSPAEIVENASFVIQFLSSWYLL